MSQSSGIDPSTFTYIRTVISIIVGLSIGRLLTGLARFVQHPGQQIVFPAHLVWTFFLLIYVIHFWWWEFHLGNIQWTFLIYCFVVLYASTIFFLCTLLYPDTMYEYKGFEDYFMSRRGWFFGIFIAILLLDIIDVLIKGQDYMMSLGYTYWIRQAFYAVGSLVAISDRRIGFQTTFAVIALASELVWAVALYNTLVNRGG